MEEKIFEKIHHKGQAGDEYWLARELAVALGYKDWRNFRSIVGKAQKLCAENNAKVEDHFVECTEMAEVGSGAQREVASFRLTRYACLLIAMCVNAKKPQALSALQFFSGRQEIVKGIDLYVDTDIVFFSDPEGNLRVWKKRSKTSQKTGEKGECWTLQKSFEMLKKRSKTSQN